jgi:hypothetical protein
LRFHLAEKIAKAQRAECRAQVVEYLPSQCKALSSNSSTMKMKKKKEEEE